MNRSSYCHARQVPETFCRLMRLGAMAVVILSVAAIETVGFASERNADWVVGMVRRVHQVGIPRELPQEIKGLVDRLVREEYDGSYVTDGFLTPELIQSRDKKLYRELKRYWAMSRRARLSLIPGLAKALVAEKDNGVQVSLGEILDDLVQASVDLKGAMEVILPALLQIVESGAPVEQRRLFLEALTGFYPLADSDRTGRLLTLARGKDRSHPAMREAEILALTRASRKEMRPEIREYLLEAARSEKCVRCRVLAAHGLRGKIPKDRWVEVAFSTLEESFKADPDAASWLIWPLVQEADRTRMLPVLIEILQTEDPIAGAKAIVGLEEIVGLGGDAMGYDTLARLRVSREGFPDPARGKKIDAQQEARVAWLGWWDKHCLEYSSRCGD